MASDLVFCGCRHCKRGMRSKNTSKYIQTVRRKYRRKVKQMLKVGNWENVPNRFPVGYTD